MTERLDKIAALKQAGASCRTCKHFYHTTSIRPLEFSANATSCKLKEKEVRYYHICEHHDKLRRN